LQNVIFLTLAPHARVYRFGGKLHTSVTELAAILE